MSETKQILFIAYQFPPLNVGGSERPKMLTKYLPEFNVNPYVLTLDPDSYEKVYGDVKGDESMLTDLPEQVKIIPVPSGDLVAFRKNKFSHFLSVYFNIHRGIEKFFWKKQLYRKVQELMQDNSLKIDLILVTAPPFGMLTLASRLSKKYNLPLVVDMRDHWTYWNITPFNNYFNYLFTKLQERKIFKQASKIIGVTNEQINDFISIHPSIPENKFKWIPNGYDGQSLPEQILYTPKDKIVIGYTGSFYYNPDTAAQMFKPFWKKKGHRMFQYTPRKEEWRYRSPFYFFKNIRYLVDQQPDWANKLIIKFAGRKPYWFDSMVAEFNLDKMVQHVGKLKKKEVIEFQNNCDFMLLTSVKVPDGYDYCVAGKTFEHIALGIPILGFVTPGAQQQFLKSAGVSTIFDPDDVEENCRKLITLLSNSKSYKLDTDFLIKFHRRNIAKEMAEVIHESAT